jgi:hypothetical protein
MKSLVENFSWETKNDHKTLVIIWKNEFQIVANRHKKSSGGTDLQILEARISIPVSRLR